MINNAVEKERQLDANRAIAQKIRNRLQQLENATKIDKKRWIWELLQNAKDTILDNNKVDIEITLSHEYLEFKHNGGFFSPRNITNLVHQISSKEGTDSTGRFGTGFLTTHTLSRLVDVSSIYIDEDINEYFEFSISLNREGSTEEDFIENIAKTWKSYNYQKIEKTNKCKTIFRYLNPNKDIVTNALQDVEESILFNLTFVEKIGKVTITNLIQETEYSFSLKDKKYLFKNIYLYTFSVTTNGKEEKRFLLKSSGNDIDTCIEVTLENENYKFKSINKKLSRLFCDFPLIGTENFSFPVVLNSRKFLPKTERDGLYLQGDGKFAIQNKELITQATVLYSQLLDYVTKDNFKEFHVIAKHDIPPKNDSFDHTWYKKDIQSKIRTALLTYPVIELENNNLAKIEDIYFPFANEKSIRMEIWNKTFDLYPNSLPFKKHIENWYMITKDWNACNYQKIETLVTDIESEKNIETLSEKLKMDKDKTLLWLNDTCKFIYKLDVELLDNHSILPNQYGVFKLKSELYSDDNIPTELKNILNLNGVDIRDELLDKNLSDINMKHRKKTMKTVLKELNESIVFSSKLTKNTDGSYADEDYNEYTEEQYSEIIERIRKVVFRLLGYSSVSKVEESHQEIWEFSRTLYFAEVSEKIELIENIEDYDLHEESFKWLIIQIIKDVSKTDNIFKLERRLNGSPKPIEWLNSLISFTQKDENFKHIIDLDEYIILPNQYGYFCSKSELFLDDELDNKLKDVLKEINPTWIEELLDTNIYLKLPENRERKFKDITEEIDKSFRTYTGDKQNPEFIKAFRKLLLWTKNSSNKNFEEYFNWVYSHKAELSLSILGDDKEKDEIFKIIESGKAPLLSKIANSSLTDRDLEDLANNTEEFKNFIDLKKSGKSILEEQDLINKINSEFGEEFSSFDEFKKKYKAKGTNIIIDTELSEGSDREVDWEAIKRSNEEAKERVKEYLSKNADYNLINWREQSKTIIVGVKKMGIDITLVIKGANHGNIYFDKGGKEKRVLKNSFTELWVNNQGNIMSITLGKLIEDQKIQVIKTS